MTSKTGFGLLRPKLRLLFSLSQFEDQVRDCNFLSLGYETEPEFSESQCQDRVLDCIFLNHNIQDKAETETIRVSNSRPRTRVALCSGLEVTCTLSHSLSHILLSSISTLSDHFFEIFASFYTCFFLYYPNTFFLKSVYQKVSLVVIELGFYSTYIHTHTRSALI